MEKVRILLTSVGVATGPNVISSLRKANDFSFHIVGVDNDNLAAGLYLCDAHHEVPRLDDPTYINVLKDIVQKEHINILFPLLSKEIFLIADHREEFEKLGVLMIIPEKKSIELCNNKNEFVKLLQHHDISSPSLYQYEDVVAKNMFPVFIKPEQGSSSRDAHAVMTQEELDFHKKKIGKLSIQELLIGPEFTIDVICDQRGSFVTGVARERLSVKDGKAVKCKTIRDEGLMELVKNIFEILSIPGPSNVQCKKVGESYSFFELNPRFSAGGLPLTTEAGVNMPLLLVKMLLDKPIRDEELEYKENVYMSRYLTEVFPKI